MWSGVGKVRVLLLIHQRKLMTYNFKFLFVWFFYKLTGSCTSVENYHPVIQKSNHWNFIWITFFVKSHSHMHVLKVALFHASILPWSYSRNICNMIWYELQYLTLITCLATLVILFQLLSCRVSLFQINVTYSASSLKLQMLPQKRFQFSWLTWLNSWLSLWHFGFWLTCRSWRTNITTWQQQNMLRTSLIWKSFTVTRECYL